MWVNWTINGGNIDRQHITLEKENVFYLLLANVSTHDGGQYLCRAFSDYSPEIPEDQEILSVKYIT